MSTGLRQQPPGSAPTVLFAGVAIGDYRRRFLECVEARIPRLQVITGDVHLEPSFKAGRDLGVSVRRVSNRFLAGRRLLWQQDVLAPALAADACVIEHNPRSLTAWAVALRRRGAGKRTVAWGHVESRGGRKKVIGSLRHLQRLICGVALYYTEEERTDARQRYGREPEAFVAPNSLYGRAEWWQPPEDRARDFLFIGRLSEDKRPDVALQAFLGARLPSDCELHIVGDGPMRSALEMLAQGSGRRVNFHGHVSAPDALAALFHRSIAAISPGYVGLSIVQSTYFGCPMIYAHGEPHAPEIVLAREGFNALSVERCAPELFASAMERAAGVFSAAGRRIEIATESVARCNAEDMAAGFVAAVECSLAGREGA